MNRSHEHHPGYRYASRNSAPLERTPAIKVGWFHWPLRIAMIAGTALVCAYSMGAFA